MKTKTIWFQESGGSGGKEASKTTKNDQLFDSKVTLRSIGMPPPGNTILFVSRELDVNSKERERWLLQSQKGELRWLDTRNGSLENVMTSGSVEKGVTITDKIRCVQQAGEMLLMITDSDLHFAKRNSYGVWEYIGKQPECPRVEFAMGRSVIEGYNAVADALPEIEVEVEGNETESIKNAVNTYMNDVENANLFAAPFFARAAYRTASGEILSVSPPTLMLPVNMAPYPMLISKSYEGAELKRVKIRLQSAPCRLLLRTFNVNVEQLRKWDVTHIDILVSQRVQMYDKEAPVGMPVRMHNKGFSNSGKPVKGEKGYKFDFHKETPLHDVAMPECYILKEYERNKINKKLQECGNSEKGWELYKRIEISEAESSEEFLLCEGAFLQKKFDLSNENMQQIIPKKVLQSGAGVIAQSPTVVMPIPALPWQLGGYYLDNGREIWHENVYNTETWMLYKSKIMVASSEANKAADFSDNNKMPRWWWYPSETAYMIGCRNGTGKAMSVKLEPDDDNNCASSFAGLEKEMPDYKFEIAGNASKDTALISFPGYMFKSQNGIIHFPKEGRLKITDGEIISININHGLSATSQFGDVPLIAITDNGVRAIRVTSAGDYYLSQMLADVGCTRESAVASLNDAIIFASDSGLYKIESGSVKELTNNLHPIKKQIREKNDRVTIKGVMEKGKIIYDGSSDVLMISGVVEGEGINIVSDKNGQEWRRIIMNSTIEAIPEIERGCRQNILVMDYNGAIYEMERNWDYVADKLSDTTIISGDGEDVKEEITQGDKRIIKEIEFGRDKRLRRVRVIGCKGVEMRIAGSNNLTDWSFIARGRDDITGIRGGKKIWLKVEMQYNQGIPGGIELTYAE